MRGIPRLCILVLLALGGCSYPNLHSVAAGQKLEQDLSLLGVWVVADETDGARYTVSELPSGQYLISVEADEDGERHVLKLAAALIRIGDHRYLEVSAAPDAVEEVLEEYGAFFIPVRHVLRLERTDRGWKVSQFKPDWIEDELQKDESALSHEHVDEDVLLITASGERLRELYRTHGSNPDAFTDAAEFVKWTPPSEPADPE